MTKLILVLCMMLVVTGVGALMWKAEATPLKNATGSLAVNKGYSAVQKAGCMFGTRRALRALKWSCADYGTKKNCVCRAC
jgi:hypothetical protein